MSPGKPARTIVMVSSPSDASGLFHAALIRSRRITSCRGNSSISTSSATAAVSASYRKPQQKTLRSVAALPRLAPVPLARPSLPFSGCRGRSNPAGCGNPVPPLNFPRSPRPYSPAFFLPPFPNLSFAGLYGRGSLLVALASAVRSGRARLVLFSAPHRPPQSAGSFHPDGFLRRLIYNPHSWHHGGVRPHMPPKRLRGRSWARSSPKDRPLAGLGARVRIAAFLQLVVPTHPAKFVSFRLLCLLSRPPPHRVPPRARAHSLPQSGRCCFGFVPPQNQPRPGVGRLWARSALPDRSFHLVLFWTLAAACRTAAVPTLAAPVRRNAGGRVWADQSVSRPAARREQGRLRFPRRPPPARRKTGAAGEPIRAGGVFGERMRNAPPARAAPGVRRHGAGSLRRPWPAGRIGPPRYADPHRSRGG